MKRRTGIPRGFSAGVCAGFALTLIASSAFGSCIGDCSGTATVSITELTLMVNIVLDAAPFDACPAGDGDGDGAISVDEIIGAVNVVLAGCPTPTPTPTPNGALLCSSGANDGAACSGDADCAPDGACVVAAGVCDGGDRDGQSCGCPGSTCVPQPCNSETYLGACVDGIAAGTACLIDATCPGGHGCVATQRLCRDGEYKSRCLRDEHCPGSTCIASGAFCCGGNRLNGKPCVDDRDCRDDYNSTCQTAGSGCARAFPTPVPAPTDPPPTPAPVHFTAVTVVRAADKPEAFALADFNGDGVTDVVTANSGADSISVLLGQAGGRFVLAAGSPFDTGGRNPAAIAVGDLDADGHADLIVAHRYTATLSILLGAGDGSFILAPAAPSGASTVAVADMDGDGRLDIVTVAIGYGGVVVLFQQPDHGFAPLPGTAPDYGCVESLVVADINDDGRLDVVVNCSSSFSVLLQQTDHTLQPLPGSPFSTGFGGEAHGIVVADMDGDRRLDVAAANTGCDCASLFLQQADGTFAAAAGSPFAVRGRWPSAVAIADMNADGIPDLVTANAGSDSASVLWGLPNATFISAPGSPYPAGARPSAVAVEDVNADGILDVLVLDSASAAMSVLLGQRDGSYRDAPGSPFSAGLAGLNSMTIADFNSDGVPDLATANRGSHDVSVFLGRHNYTYAAAPESPYALGPLPPIGLAVGDFDGDGRPDLATANQSWPDGGVSVLGQEADHGFVELPGSPLAAGGVPKSIAAGDTNRDGLADLVTSYGYNFGGAQLGPRINLWLAQPDRRFVIAPGWPMSVAGWSPSAVALADLNRDNILELVVASQDPGMVTLLRGLPDHQFTPAPGSPYAVGDDYPHAIALGDFNGDWSLDIATGNSGSVSLLLAQSDGSFARSGRSPFEIGVSDVESIAAIDLNGDGMLDLVVGGGRDFGDTRAVSVALQQADETFMCSAYSVAAREAVSVAVADLNGDGRPDIATASPAGIVLLLQDAP